MDNNNKITINRRQFNRGALTAGLISAFPYGAFSKTPALKSDGLIQLKKDGRVYLYSSGGYLGLYDDHAAFEELAAVAGCSRDDLIIVHGGSAQQPCVLGQSLNAMSYSEMETSLRAARKLAQIREGRIPENPVIVTESGIARATKDMIRTLERQGIIVAVRG